MGDWVYVKLQPYIQQSVARRANQKLSYKYFRPYLVLQTVGKVAYKLQLPANSQIHPVLHVSQLKKALPPNTTLSTYDELQLLYMMEGFPSSQVLDTRLHLVGRRVPPMYRRHCFSPLILHREGALQLKEGEMSRTSLRLLFELGCTSCTGL